MKIDHIPRLTKYIKTVLNQHQTERFPMSVHFNKGMEHPEFVITIEKSQLDTYTDASGQKWKKVQ